MNTVRVACRVAQQLFRSPSCASGAARGLRPPLGPRGDCCRLLRRHNSGKCGMKVTIAGANGATGQPLALLLKQSPLLDEIALYDQCSTALLAQELQLIDTKATVSSYTSPACAPGAFCDSRLVIIVVRKSMCGDTFRENAPAVAEMAMYVTQYCPDAITIVATEPVESHVPLVAEIMRLRNAYNPRRLVGCVECNRVRANTILAEHLGVPPSTVRVPLIGGARPETMVPLLSRADFPGRIKQDQVECITDIAMNSNKYMCCCLPCLTGAYSVVRTALNCVKGMQGEKVTDCAYIDSLDSCVPYCQFFTCQITLGPGGVEQIEGVPDISWYEHCLLLNCLPYVRTEINRAIFLVYSMCVHCPSCIARKCFAPGLPAQWSTCPGDEQLAQYCRDLSIQCGCALCWRPRTLKPWVPTDHLPVGELASPCACRLPASIRMIRPSCPGLRVDKKAGCPKSPIRSLEE